MSALAILELVVTLLEGVAAAFNKTGLANLGADLLAAAAKVREVHGSAVTKAQIESLRITPQW